nr:C6 transcription factor [Colletotrichum truncatum]KAF6791575.1 C6 transcription factor [Colletotrichum truncatum]
MASPSGLARSQPSSRSEQPTIMSCTPSWPSLPCTLPSSPTAPWSATWHTSTAASPSRACRRLSEPSAATRRMPSWLPRWFCHGKRRIGRRSWTQLMQGTSSVIEAMDPWKHESQFGDFIAESCTFPTAPASPSPDHKPSQPRKEDIDAFTKTLQQLQKVEAHLKHNKEDTKSIQQLISFLKGARKVNTGLSVSQQFERLRPLRTWLFWLPVMYLKQTGGSPSALVIIAHYYTVALVTERLFPDIGAAYFGSLSIGPVEEIARRLLSINISGSLDGDLQTPLTLMEYPIDTVNEFRHRMGWTQPARTPSFPQFNPPNFYMSEPVPLPPVSDSYLPYGQNPAFSYSTESLQMLNAESAPPNNLSPLVLSSPYVNSQYLNIPSPNYGGYSPASSTFEGSVVYSDTEDYGSYENYDISGMPAVHNNLGVGFVSPIQSVWI